MSFEDEFDMEFDDEIEDDNTPCTSWGTPDKARSVLTWIHGGAAKCASSVNLRWPSWT